MKATSFRMELRSRLVGPPGDVRLRIAIAPSLEEPIEFTGPELLALADDVCRRYAGGPAGAVVLLLLPHSVELFALHLGLVLNGYCPAILPWPTSRVDPEKYQRNLVHQLGRLAADQLITLPSLAHALDGRLPYPVTACNTAGAPAVDARRLSIEPISGGLPPSQPHSNLSDDALFLQFSGGTTGTQKSVVVTASMLCAQLDRLRDVLGFSRVDGVVSWLPLYHDMGLVACFWFPLWHGAPSLHFAASDWLLNPGRLFTYVERYRATFCWLPNFAFSYLAGRQRETENAPALGHVRGWINCSEPVRATSFRRFLDAFSASGVREDTLQASYAMAENVFAVTQSTLGAPPLQIARHAVGAPTSDDTVGLLDRVFVGSGCPLPDTDVRVVAPGGAARGELQPGEIQLRSPSLFGGYWPGGTTVTPFTSDGWYATGDYGFFHRGNLFVIGRLKDIVIVAGQNVFPEDVEMLVGSLPDVHPGRVVAFGVDDDDLGTESLAVVAEAARELDAAQAQRLVDEIKSLVFAAVGVAPRHAVIVPQQWIVKSTAGKISRPDTRRRFLDERAAREPRVGEE